MAVTITARRLRSAKITGILYPIDENIAIYDSGSQNLSH
jgi:hypothetical protein